MTASAISANDAEQIRSALYDRVSGAFRGKGAAGERLLRAEMEVPAFDPLHWLAAQETSSRGFWSDREQRFELAGIGRADTVTSTTSVQDTDLLQRLHRRIEDAEGEVRYFGGLRFSAGGARGSEWDPFGTYRFVLPRVEVLRRNGSSVLAVNMWADESPVSIRRELDRLRFPAAEANNKPAPPRRRLETPGRESWIQTVERTRAVLGEEGFQKVVMARRLTLHFDQAPDPIVLLRALRAGTADCFHFCFQPCPGHAFLGASPERLYRRDGRDILTEAIAGTASRSEDAATDAQLAADLMASAKERREQRLVVDSIAHILAPRCVELATDPEPRVLTLSRNQHLATRFRGRLREGVTDAELLTELHPTPAVGGCPRDIAERYIEEHEPFDRGWFAGPVGWVARDAAQFAVGIRSGLVDEDRLHAYAGAGILPASDPAGEWEETEQKLGDLLSLFG